MVHEHNKRPGHKTLRNDASHLARERGQRSRAAREDSRLLRVPSDARHWQEENIKPIEKLVQSGHALVAGDEKSSCLDWLGSVCCYGPSGKVPASAASGTREKVTAAGPISAPGSQTGKPGRLCAYGWNPN